MNRPAPRGLWERLYDALGERQGAALFAAVKASGATRPRFDLASLLLGVLSAAVLAGLVALPGLAATVAALGWPNLFALAGGALLLAVAWFTRPRLLRLPPEILTTADTHPQLHRLVADVARELGVAPPSLVALPHHLEAFAGRMGLRQRRVVGIGLPILLAGGTDVWIAVLAHELGHFANGDTLRGVPVAVAQTTLAGWCAVLTPEHPDEVASEGIAGWLALHVLWLLGIVPRLLLRLMAHLSWRGSQRAEYYADRIGASVSGTEAFVRALELVENSALLLEQASHAVVVAGARTTVYEEMNRLEAAWPEAERERRRELRSRVVPSLDATHPPIAYRIRILEEGPRTLPRFTVRSEHADAILREIASDARRGEQALISEHRRRLEG